MKASVFLYDEQDSGYLLYVGQLTTAECLSYFEGNTKLTINEFGATLYKKYGWATEKELPEINIINDLLNIFNKEGDIGLIAFEALIDGVGLISSHDDGECQINFKEKHELLNFIKKLIPNEYQNLLINKLLENKGLYVTCNENGKIEKYHSFDEYLEKHA